jgi:hypothetical protein
MTTTKTKERGILMTGRNVCRILDDRKTKTRRVISNAPPKADRLRYKDGFLESWLMEEWWPVVHAVGCETPVRCPYGQVGDRLYVRETWRPIHHRQRKADTYVRYKADDGLKSVMHTLGMDVPTHWRPSIHMPRWASRIDLEIEKIRVERLQEITEEDAIAEGACLDGHICHVGEEKPHRAVFAHTWNDINEKRGFGWEANPWVWVIDFRRIRR